MLDSKIIIVKLTKVMLISYWAARSRTDGAARERITSACALTEEERVRWMYKEMFDLTGRVAIVTGGSRGIGGWN